MFGKVIYYIKYKYLQQLYTPVLPTEQEINYESGKRGRYIWDKGTAKFSERFWYFPLKGLTLWCGQVDNVKTICLLKDIDQSSNKTQRNMNMQLIDLCFSYIEILLNSSDSVADPRGRLPDQISFNSRSFFSENLINILG